MVVAELKTKVEKYETKASRCEQQARAATDKAVCTSSAAPSILRLRSNWTVICVLPSDDDEVIEEMPAMVDNCRSIGDATAAAIVSGLAPGKLADTLMVGKATAGSAATGSRR